MSTSSASYTVVRKDAISVDPALAKAIFTKVAEHKDALAHGYGSTLVTLTLAGRRNDFVVLSFEEPNEALAEMIEKGGLISKGDLRSSGDASLQGFALLAILYVGLHYVQIPYRSSPAETVTRAVTSSVLNSAVMFGVDVVKWFEVLRETNVTVVYTAPAGPLNMFSFSGVFEKVKPTWKVTFPPLAVKTLRIMASINASLQRKPDPRIQFADIYGRVKAESNPKVVSSGPTSLLSTSTGSLSSSSGSVSESPLMIKSSSLLTKQIEALEIEKNNIKAQLDTALVDLAEQDSEYKKEIAKLESRIDEQSNNLTNMVSNLEKSRVALESKDRDISRLTYENNILKSTTSASDKDAAYKKQLKALEDDIAKRDIQILENLKTITERETQISQLRTQFQNTEKTLIEAQKETNKATDEKEKLQKSLEGLRSILKESDALAEERTTKLDQLNDELIKAKSDLAASSTKLEEQKFLNEKLKLKSDETERLLREAQEKLFEKAFNAETPSPSPKKSPTDVAAELSEEEEEPEKEEEKPEQTPNGPGSTKGQQPSNEPSAEEAEAESEEEEEEEQTQPKTTTTSSERDEIEAAKKLWNKYKNGFVAKVIDVLGQRSVKAVKPKGKSKAVLPDSARNKAAELLQNGSGPGGVDANALWEGLKNIRGDGTVSGPLAIWLFESTYESLDAVTKESNNNEAVTKATKAKANTTHNPHPLEEVFIYVLTDGDPEGNVNPERRNREGSLSQYGGTSLADVNAVSQILGGVKSQAHIHTPRDTYELSVDSLRDTIDTTIESLRDAVNKRISPLALINAQELHNLMTKLQEANFSAYSEYDEVMDELTKDVRNCVLPNREEIIRIINQS